MKFPVPFLLSVFAAAFAVTAPGQQLGDVSRDFMAGNLGSYLLLPPDVVSGSITRSVSWSSDGLYLAVVRTPNPLTGEFIQDSISGKVTSPNAQSTIEQILVYGVRSKRAKLVCEIDRTTESVELTWLTGADNLLVMHHGTGVAGMPSNSTLEMFHAASGNSVTIATSKPNETFTLETSPVSPEAILQFIPFAQGAPAATPAGQNAVSAPLIAYSRSAMTCCHLNDQGKLGQSTVWPEDMQWPHWANNGQVLATKIIREPGKQTTVEWYRVDPKSWLMTRGEKPSSERLKHPSDAFAVQTESKGPEHYQQISVGLRDSDGKVKAIVCSDGSDARISPSGNAIVYSNQGVAMVREIVKIPKDVYLRIKRSHDMTVALSNARQVALALITYASDSHDILPPNGVGWKDWVMPYVESAETIQDFVYTFQGGAMKDISSPATTILGAIDGPGGRAVAYADGHVKWVPNP